MRSTHKEEKEQLLEENKKWESFTHYYGEEEQKKEEQKKEEQEEEDEEDEEEWQEENERWKSFPPQFPQGGAVKGQAATDCKRDRSKSSKSHLSICHICLTYMLFVLIFVLT